MALAGKAGGGYRSDVPETENADRAAHLTFKPLSGRIVTLARRSGDVYGKWGAEKPLLTRGPLFKMFIINKLNAAKPEPMPVGNAGARNCTFLESVSFVVGKRRLRGERE